LSLKATNRIVMLIPNIQFRYLKTIHRNWNDHLWYGGEEAGNAEVSLHDSTEVVRSAIYVQCVF